jgi:two-component sensor histidine kinase
MEHAEQIIARVQNTQKMEMEDNKKKAADDLRNQQVELASTKREMKAIKKQWQWDFAEFQKQLTEKLKDMPMELDLSIRSIAKSIADDNKPENAE